MSFFTLFELYSANVPLLVPTRTLLERMCAISSLSNYGGGGSRYRYHGATPEGAPHRQTLPRDVGFFLDRADFYDTHADAMPHLHYFDSFDALADAVRAVDPAATSSAMAAANAHRARRVHSAWACMMGTAFPQLQRDIATSSCAETG